MELLNNEFNGQGNTSIDCIRASLLHNKQEVVVVVQEKEALAGFVCVQLKKSNLVIKMIMRFICRKGYKNGEGFGYGRYRHGCQLGVRVRGLQAAG